MAIPEFRDVRVTDRTVRVTEGRREAVKVDFIAPDIAPVSTHALEMDKGSVGWTDFDTKPADVRPLHIQRAEKARKVQARTDALGMTCGATVIRAQAPAESRVYNAGPSQSYRDAQIAAQKLVERNRREAAARRAARSK